MADHTPGPWQWDAGDGGQVYSAAYCQVYVNDGDLIIADVNDKFDREQGHANARLIAAAPETAAERDRLRHELAGLRQWVRDGYAKKSVLERFDAALATAKQKEPADV